MSEWNSNQTVDSSVPETVLFHFVIQRHRADPQLRCRVCPAEAILKQGLLDDFFLVQYQRVDRCARVELRGIPGIRGIKHQV